MFEGKTLADEGREGEFFESEDQFMQLAAVAPRSNCVMDNSKLLSTGVSMSHVEDAIVKSLRSWVPSN